MKFLHTADIHLGQSWTPEPLTQKREREYGIASNK